MRARLSCVSQQSPEKSDFSLLVEQLLYTYPKANINRSTIENIVSGNREVNNKEYPLRKEVNIIFPLDNLLPPSYNPANQILKTLTRTSTFQSDFQRAKQK